MELKTAREQLMTLQARQAALYHAMGLISYDGATTAPRATTANRAQTLSILSEESYKLSTGEETVRLLEYLDENKAELSAKEQRMVYLLLKDIRRMRSIPMEEYIEYQKLMVEADDVWHRAKEESDFEAFRPYLEKIFATQKRFAGYCAPEKHPYDYWLGEYEEGLDRQACDRFFATLREHIVPLIKKIQSAQQIDDSCVHGHFPLAQQEAFSEFLMQTLGIDMGHCGISTTEHPFTTSLGSHHDVRITTNYDESNLADSMYSVIHEGGHALYDMGSADDLAYTVLDGGASMAIHESQSRFYENLIGRDRRFVELIFPQMKEFFPTLKFYSAEDLYRAVNRSEPSLIRTEADEVTYCLHIMVRYELEKRILDDELEVKDLPAEWNRLYKEYLGVDVPDDRRGVLQDTHWAGGMIGYFPSYALGSAYGAQLLAKMKEEVDVDKCLSEGDFEPINAWNREHIWKHGCVFASGELLEKALGAQFDPKYYTDYLEEKYSALYGL
ncbi:MAG: carboxypeptidase M32 [Eubacteriales bacterium]|nr:carboxypeptidase M32 [Eubacteriales bacterium]